MYIGVLYIYTIYVEKNTQHMHTFITKYSLYTSSLYILYLHTLYIYPSTYFYLIIENKQEEKEDLWQLWNDIRDDGDEKASLLGTASHKIGSIKASFHDKNALIKREQDHIPTRNNTKYNYIDKHMMKSNIISSTKTTFELNNNGVFSSPTTVTSTSNNNNLHNTTNTYTYNTNTYNIHTPPTTKIATSPLR